MTVLDAQRYDAWFDRPWGRHASRIERAALIAAVPQRPGRVLDAGCGTGRLTVTADATFVVGIDRDLDMLRIARTRIAGPLVQADADHLPFADDTFDLTTAVTLCEFTQSPEHTIAELVRVTRPGGRVVIGGLSRQSPWGLANHKQLGLPPWSNAHLLTEGDFRRYGAIHGTVGMRTVLYAPGAWPGLGWWGPALDAIGPIIAPRHGAFIVMTIDLPAS